MTQRLRFILDGDDNLTRVLNHAGDSSARLHRRLNDDMDGNSRAVRGFTQDADGRFRDLRGRFLSVADAQRMMAGGMPDLTRRLGDVSGAAGSAGEAGIGLMGALKGVAVVAGMSLLPALGALVPMAAGAGLALGTLKLGFAGVGDAMAVAGDKKKFAEQLKKMSPEARDFTKSLVSLKKEFGGIGKEIQKAMLPGFTKAVQAAGPVVKILGKSMTEMGDAFGDAAEGVGRLLKDSGFQDALQANLKLGIGFIKDMTSAMGPFVRSLLDFGAASGPTLKAFSDGIGGLLTKGLPGMFQGLQQGIPGAAKMLDGLFSAVNNILPALGRLSGEMGKTLGPVFGETFRLLGGMASGAMDALAGELKVLSPLFRDLTFGLKSVRDLAKIVGPTLADTGNAILGAFLPMGSSVEKAVGPLQRLNQAINNNKGAILEGTRIFGDAMIGFVSASLQATPKIIHAFMLMSGGILTAMSGIVHGAATAFGWVPGIGSKLKSADRAFSGFKDNYITGLSKAETAASKFAAATLPKLNAGKLKMDISNWQQQIEAAKAKMKTVPPSKQAALKATIKDLQDKVATAKQNLADLKGKSVGLTAKDLISPKARAAYLAVQALHSKTITLTTEHRNVYTGKGGRGANAYASGGNPMAGELAMVGEQGPELVVFGQAAKVFDAKTTKSILGGPVGAGRAAGQGLALGLGATGGVYSAARAMAAAVTAGVRDELEIASPSKKMKALAKDIGKGLIVGLTGTRDKIKATAKDLANDIKTAFSGKKESSLLKMVDKQTKKLLDLADKRDKIAAKIAEAKSYASDVTKNARSQAGLSNLGMSPEEVTAGGIKAGLASKLAQIKQFSKYISMLAKRGLNKGLLRQILDMGPIDGYAYASALVGADKATFSAINKTQASIDKESKKLGNKGADILYDSGKNAGKGFLAGLQGQKKHIEKLMMDIAKGMQKSLRKALGISSPAKKMIPDGINTMKGVAVGILRGLPHIDDAMAAAAGRMTGVRPVRGRPAVAAAGGGAMNVNITVADARDPIAVAKEIRRELLELKRVFGLNVELKVG